MSNNFFNFSDSDQSASDSDGFGEDVASYFGEPSSTAHGTPSSPLAQADDSALNFTLLDEHWSWQKAQASSQRDDALEEAKFFGTAKRNFDVEQVQVRSDRVEKTEMKMKMKMKMKAKAKARKRRKRAASALKQANEAKTGKNNDELSVRFADPIELVEVVSSEEASPIDVVILNDSEDDEQTGKPDSRVAIVDSSSSSSSSSSDDDDNNDNSLVPLSAMSSSGVDIDANRGMLTSKKARSAMKRRAKNKKKKSRRRNKGGGGGGDDDDDEDEANSLLRARERGGGAPGWRESQQVRSFVFPDDQMASMKMRVSSAPREVVAELSYVQWFCMMCCPCFMFRGGSLFSDAFKEELRKAMMSLCAVLSLAQLIVMIVGLGLGGISDTKNNPAFGPSEEILVRLGAESADRIKSDAELWRIFTSLLVNAGVLHIALNLFVQLRVSSGAGDGFASPSSTL
jgi:hypothetical protein